MSLLAIVVGGSHGIPAHATSTIELDVQRCRVLPRRELRTEGVPLCVLKLEVGRGEILTQRILDYVVALIGAQSVQEVERQARGILHEMPFAIHIDVMMRSWVSFFAVKPLKPAAMITACRRYGFTAPSARSEFETTGTRHADHVCPVIARPGHGVWRPRCS